MKRALLSLLLLIVFVPPEADAAELVRLVRLKITAGDILSGAAYAEDYKLQTGVDKEYLDAIGWLARGALLTGRHDLARDYVAELHRAIPKETADLVVPFGAAIEVEGRLIAANDGRGAALRYLDAALQRAEAPALRSRIRKNMNLLSLEGEVAPEIDSEVTLASRRGKPVLLYFFAEWCGDCKAQATSLGRIWEKYRARGLDIVAVTRLYGGEGEEQKVAKVWKEVYPAMQDVPVVINTDTMIRYGASATPTFALVDRKGIVRLYTPTRLSEAAMAKAIEEVLGE
ncbi:MAG TPA: TlpA disulfide reductase family protein [Thermoanaerobaculia bacterium]